MADSWVDRCYSSSMLSVPAFLVMENETSNSGNLDFDNADSKMFVLKMVQ
jgi:hypothetical protein